MVKTWVKPALIGTVGLNFLKIVDVSGVSPIDSAPSIAAGASATLRTYMLGGGTLGIFGWGCAAGILEPLAYTRARSSEFCYPILD